MYLGSRSRLYSWTLATREEVPITRSDEVCASCTLETPHVKLVTPDGLFCPITLALSLTISRSYKTDPNQIAYLIQYARIGEDVTETKFNSNGSHHTNGRAGLPDDGT